MKTEVLRFNKSKPEAAKLKKVVEVMRNGGVIIFPTDTVYGLACSAFNSEARKKIYGLKGRSYRKPLIIMSGTVSSMLCLFSINDKVSKIMEKFWPGPLTLVLPCTDIGKIVMGGRENIGVRVPAEKTALSILKACDFPVATTSANPSSKPSAKSFKEALKYFDGKVDIIIDSGKCKAARESTVLDVTHFPYTVIRHGCLNKSLILDSI